MYLVQGKKVVEAHRLAGYSGNEHASYALKCKLKSHLSQMFEIKGVSKDRYLADLLQLLDLPCVDGKGNKLESLKFDQYLAVRKLLREELPSTKVATPSITAFVVQRFDQAKDDTKKADVIDIPPVSGRSNNVAT